ncbi:ATP-binding protein [Pseudoalteromonas sp. T1lg65]|uniref:ATP-binding protein n=1 Tax=Pseudoalteromonas sp. T1lg65 TaxID=2077101 RepID=UPI003F7AF41C
MKLTIRVKLLLVILIANTALVLAIYVANKLAFEKSFSQYVENTSRVELQEIVVLVSQTYEKHGNLNWVYKNSPDWENIVRQFYGAQQLPPRNERYERRPPPRPRFEDQQHRPPRQRPRPGPRGERKRLLLKDAQGNLVMGNKQNSKDSLWFPVYENEHLENAQHDKVIAYLGVEASGLIRNEFDQLFAQQQQRQFILIAVIALLVTVIIAIPFSKYLVTPIIQLRRNAKLLAQGNFEAHTEISSKDELGLLARDMNRLADTLAQNQTARQQWIADISHELRTPIAVIRAELEGMIDGVINSDPEQLQSLHEEIQRLTRLVDDLHQLSLSDRGSLSYNMAKHNLHDILSRTFAKCSHQLELSHFQVHLQCDTGLTIDCDEQRLGQLFDNLLQNTIRYTDSSQAQPGTIDVSVNHTGAITTIYWQDSAPTVPEDQIDKLFDRLYRVDKHRNRASGGSGLGLAICQSIAEAHNGNISAHLSDLGGLAIMIELRR